MGGRFRNILFNQATRLISRLEPVPAVSAGYIDALITNNNWFQAEINKCIDPYGNNYGDGWHYFTSMVRNIGRLQQETIVASFVRYLELTTHDNVFGGFRLNLRGSEGLKDFSPSALPFLTPWSPFDISRIEDNVAVVVKEEKLSKVNEGGGHSPLKDLFHLALNHYNRLSDLLSQIKEKGYDMSSNPDDPVMGYVLTRENDHRILIFSGQHRVAVMSALNSESIPVRFVNKLIIDQAGVDQWPLIRKGLWNKEDALLYFNHLFEFDSGAWAKEQGLLV